ASGEPKLVVLDEDHVHKLLKSGHVSSWRFFRLSWSLFCSRRSRRLRSCRQREERRCKRNTEYGAASDARRRKQLWNFSNMIRRDGNVDADTATSGILRILYRRPARSVSRKTQAPIRDAFLRAQ